MRKLVSKNVGFTLIELLITVVIIGVLAAIAVPSYNQYVTQSRRADAQTVLMALAMAQEKHRANYPAYGNLTASGTISTASGTTYSPSIYYDFTIPVANALSYTITASATVPSGQATKDAACPAITLNQNGDKTPPGCWKS